MSKTLHLKAPNSMVIGFTLPLHETIDDQWRKGHLTRVTGPDGGQYIGDQYDLSDLQEDEAGQEPAESGPEGDEQPGGSTGEEGQDPAAGTGGEGTSPGGDGQPGADVTQPERPALNASKQAWQDYAVALDACTEEEAAAMNREQLIKVCTPPEIDPLSESR